MNISRTRTGMMALSLIACFTLIGSGCKSSQNSTDGLGYTRTSDGAVVPVKLDEYQIHMPTTIPAGHIDFQIQNTGRMAHNIKIEGNGVSRELDKSLSSGQTADLVVDLPAGSYHVICPVLTHADLGMRLDLTVQ